MCCPEQGWDWYWLLPWSHTIEPHDQRTEGKEQAGGAWPGLGPFSLEKRRPRGTYWAFSP